jgi:nitrogen fixation protein FixH
VFFAFFYDNPRILHSAIGFRTSTLIMQSKSQHTHRLNPWPVSIVAFFTVAIVGCVSFVAFCSRHPADLVAADYYEQEVRYQAQIKRNHNAGKAQPARVAYDQATQRIILTLPNPWHAEIDGHIHLYRPSAINLDSQLKLELNSEGMQSIDARSLLPGLWKVRVSWKVADEEYFIDEKVLIGARSS